MLSGFLKHWKPFTRWALILGFLCDLLNLWGCFRVSTNKPPGRPSYYENHLALTNLPACAFAEVFEEEAEPAFYWNLGDWLWGIGPAEESALAKAEYRIWHNVVEEKPATVDVYSFAWGDSFLDLARKRHQLEEQRGLRKVEKSFYFDRAGYHARLKMGRPRELSSPKVFNQACEVDLGAGVTANRSPSLPFSCGSLDRVIAREIEGIHSEIRPDGCWASYRYDVDFKTMKVTFQEEFYVRREGAP